MSLVVRVKVCNIDMTVQWGKEVDKNGTHHVIPVKDVAQVTINHVVMATRRGSFSSSAFDPHHETAAS